MAKTKAKTRTIIKYRKGKTITRYRKRRTKRRVSGGRTKLFSGPVKKAVAAGAAGFLFGQPAVALQIAKLPKIGNRTLTAGIAAYFINKMVIKNNFVGQVSEAAIIAGAFDFGAKGFDLETFEDSADRTGIIKGHDEGGGYYDVSGTLDEDDEPEFDEEEFDDVELEEDEEEPEE